MKNSYIENKTLLVQLLERVRNKRNLGLVDFDLNRLNLLYLVHRVFDDAVGTLQLFDPLEVVVQIRLQLVLVHDADDLFVFLQVLNLPFYLRNRAFVFLHLDLLRIQQVLLYFVTRLGEIQLQF